MVEETAIRNEVIKESIWFKKNILGEVQSRILSRKIY